MLGKDGPRVEAEDPKAGDLVICQTSGRFNAHPYVVGWAETNYNTQTGHCLVRELGGDRVSNISNEKFYVIRGVREELLFEGAQYVLHQKVLKAITKLDNYFHRWHSTRFDGEDLVIVIREAFGGRMKGEESVPYEVRMPWDKRTTIKTIVAVLKEAGFGERKFEKKKVSA